MRANPSVNTERKSAQPPWLHVRRQKFANLSTRSKRASRSISLYHEKVHTRIMVGSIGT